MLVHESPVAAEDASQSPPRKRIKIDEQTHDMTMMPNISTEPLVPDSVAQPSTDPALNSIPSVSAKMESAPLKGNTALHDQVDKEVACGITEFVCPDLLGFTGVLKKRYTDFLVNEILPSGEVVHLDNTQPPKKKKASDGVKGSAPIQSASEVHKEAVQDVEKPVKQETVGALSDAGKHVDTIASRPISPTDNSQAAVGPDLARNYTEKAVDGAGSACPESMKDYDLPSSKPESLAPHLRDAPQSSSVPLSMRDLDKEMATPKPSRKREKVRIRRTSQGWEEIDENEKALNGEQAPEEKPGDTHEQDARPGLENSAGVGVSGDTTTQEAIAQEEVQEPPSPSTQASWQAFATTAAADTGANTGFKLNSEDMTTLMSYFGPEITNDILALHERIVNSPHRKSRDYGMVKSAVIDRQTRSKIHQDIRRMFSSRLETITDNEGRMIITALPEKPTFFGRTPADGDHKNQRNNGRARGDRGRGGRGGNNNNRDGQSRQSRQSQWAELGGDHLHFSLCKENKDTMEAVSWLARQLNMKPSAFQFAGTKDRRGVTVQRVSVYRVFADRLAQVGRALRAAKIGNFEYQPHGLQLGELKGNEFTITLRECDFHYPDPVGQDTLIDTAKAIVGDAIKNLGEHGFINYYGLQRFGTFSTSTDSVGVKMLQGDFKGAIDGILHFEPATLTDAQDPMSDPIDKISREDRARAYAINLFTTTGESSKAIYEMPRKFSTESIVIRHLGNTKNQNDHLGAFQAISRNMRLMYVHAYQSLVWNMAASHRWKSFGATVIEGDLVLIDEHKKREELEPKLDEVDADGEAIVRPTEDNQAVDPEDRFIRARALTKDEAESGKYTVFDVVLPTPGYDILYPANELAKFYEDFMGSERGGGLNPYDMRRKWKDASLSGSYRKLLAKPSEDFSFDVKVYRDEHEQFVQTDLDRLEKAKQNRAQAQHSRSAPTRDDPAKAGTNHDDAKGPVVEVKHGANPESPPSDHEPGGVRLSGGPYRDYMIAVILKLQLGSSQYATMALRELMKHGGARAYKADFSGGH